MDLAYVIKGLLNIECMFRFIGCVLINSIRGAFILWGWQPSFLIRAVGYMDWITRAHWSLESDDELSSQEAYIPNNHSLLSSVMITTNNSSHDIIRATINDSEHSNFDTIYPSIKLVCSIPSTLSVFSNYGISIFVLLTGIVR